MPTIGKIKAELHGDTRHFDRAMRRSSRQVKGFEKTLIGLKGAITPVIGAFGFGQLIRQTITEADQMAKLSRRLGANVQQFSRLGQVLERSNINIRSTAMMMQRLQRRAADAQDGNKQLAAAFDQLGINLARFMKLKPTEQFLLVAEALARTGPQAERVQLAFKLLDSEGVQLLQADLPKLREEMGRMTGYTEAQAKAIEQLTDKWAKLGQTLKAWAAEEIVSTISGIGALWDNLFQGEGTGRRLRRGDIKRRGGRIALPTPLTRTGPSSYTNIAPGAGGLGSLGGGGASSISRTPGGAFIGGNLSQTQIELLRQIERNTKGGAVLE